MPTLFILPGNMYVDSVYLNRVVRTNKNIASAVIHFADTRSVRSGFTRITTSGSAKLKLLRIYYILRTQLCLFAKLRIKLLLKGLVRSSLTPHPCRISLTSSFFMISGSLSMLFALYSSIFSQISPCIVRITS